MSSLSFLYRTELPHRAKLVYLYLYDRMDRERKAWPGLNTIAQELSLSRSTVKRAITDLERAGLLKKEPHYRENGSATSNRYIRFHFRVFTEAFPYFVKCFYGDCFSRMPEGYTRAEVSRIINRTACSSKFTAEQRAFLHQIHIFRVGFFSECTRSLIKFSKFIPKSIRC